MRCVLCGERKALVYSVVCEKCSRELKGRNPVKFARMRGILDLMGLGWVTTAEVAERVGMPESTVKKYLEELVRYGFVRKGMALRLKKRKFPRWKMVWRKIDESEV